MKIGDKVKFGFAKGEREGVVCKLNEKSVSIKADFENQKGKIIKRKVHQLKES